MKGQLSLTDFVCLPENRSGFVAVHDLAEILLAGQTSELSVLFLHGPPGSGKSHLLAGLAREITSHSSFSVLSFRAEEMPWPSEAEALVEEAGAADLLIIDDLQHLPLYWSESLIQLLDHRQAHQKATALAARSSPQQLSRRGASFPARLTSRLAAGLVVALDVLQTASRLRFLQELGRRRQLPLPDEVASWLAENLRGGGRQLETAVRQLTVLARDCPHGMTIRQVAGHFCEQAEAARPSVERIAQKVSGYFGVKTRHLQSAHRVRSVLVPRQVGMYLARRLTGLSLDQIGAYFGGRDHSTVLHACRKIEHTLASDVGLSGAVRQLQAELT
jgi:chromosomal replication initiator protein